LLETISDPIAYIGTLISFPEKLRGRLDVEIGMGMEMRVGG